MHAYVHIHALTKVISLSEEAYKTLKKRKGKGESFSDVVIRMTRDKQSRSILEFCGGWVGGDADKVAQQIMLERERVTVREYKF